MVSLLFERALLYLATYVIMKCSRAND